MRDVLAGQRHRFSGLGIAALPRRTEVQRERAEALVGRTIDGRYRIDSVIATGGMGAVYLARHLKLRKRVALKVLHPALVGDAESLRRFRNEAAVAAQLSDAHVLPIFDIVESAGVPPVVRVSATRLGMPAE